MANIPQIPEWLAEEIAQAIKACATGSVTINWNQHRVASFDLRKHGVVRGAPSVEEHAAEMERALGIYARTL